MKALACLAAGIAVLGGSLASEAQKAVTAPRSHIEDIVSQGTFANASNTSELTTAVLAQHHITGPLADVAQPITAALTTAQQAFIDRKLSAITEHQVVKAINAIAASAKAPAYAYTTEREVRETRVRLAMVEPNFIGLGSRPASKPNVLHAQLVSAQMSPLEAFHVVSTILEQKLNNPEYQMSEEERATAKRLHRSEQLSDAEAAQRATEMHQVIMSATRTASMLDIFKLASDSMKAITIPEGDQK